MKLPHPPSWTCRITGGHIWGWDKDAWYRANARALLLHEPGTPLTGLVECAEGPCVICGREWSAGAKTMSLVPPRWPTVLPVAGIAFCLLMIVMLGDWFMCIALAVNVGSLAFQVRIRLRGRRRRRAAAERAAG